MGTILVMIALLVVPYVVLTALDRSGRVRTTPGRRGVIGLALLFLFTASGHFVQTDVMADMLPPVIPWRTAIIYATGVLEAALAVALLVRSSSRLAAWAIIVFLALALPANIYAAMERVPMGAHALGPVYLLARVPLQVLIAWWAYRFGVRQSDPRHERVRLPTF
jgi:uncharacterized membrane protein